jgi:hypothetical protein
LNLRRSWKDYVFGRGIFCQQLIGVPDMTKAVRLASTVPASFVAPRPVTGDFDFSQFAPIALFSGIGLLASLAAILSGVHGAWY